MSYYSWQLMNYTEKVALLSVVGALMSVPGVMLQAGQTFRVERTTVEKVLDPLEETWHRIAPDTSTRMQSALGILKEVMAIYSLDKAVVAWDGRQLVGVAVYRMEYYADLQIWETHIYELASFTHKPGVGGLLVKEVIRIAREGNSDTVIVGCAAGTEKFYGGLGFKRGSPYPGEPNLMAYYLRGSKQLQELIGYKTMYHATPWEYWLTSISKVGLKTQFLGGWIPGETRLGIFLAVSEAAAIYFAEASWYADLGFKPSWKRLEETVTQAKPYAILTVDVPKDAPMFPDEFFILSDGSPGAYVVTQDIPRKRIHFLKKLAPSIPRAKVWDVDESLPQLGLGG